MDSNQHLLDAPLHLLKIIKNISIASKGNVIWLEQHYKSNILRYVMLPKQTKMNAFKL